MTPSTSPIADTPVNEEPQATPEPVEYTHSNIFYRRLENKIARDKEGGGLVILE